MLSMLPWSELKEIAATRQTKEIEFKFNDDYLNFDISHYYWTVTDLIKKDEIISDWEISVLNCTEKNEKNVSFYLNK